MSADLLRRAAAKIRETAQAATPGPWEQEGSSVAAGEFIILDALPDDGSGTWTKQTADAAHASLWSPDVVGDVATWLENEAHFLDATGHPLFPAALRPDHPALTLARRILGEDA